MANMRKNIKKLRSTSDDLVEKKSSNLLITVIICGIMVLIAYGLSMVIYNFTKQPSSIVDTSKYNINASSVFDMSDKQYYVMFYDKTGVDALNLNVIINNYRRDNTTPIYVVDLSKDYNKAVVSDTPNQYASNSSQLAISSSTLMKIEDGENVGYFENVLLIENELK